MNCTSTIRSYVPFFFFFFLFLLKKLCPTYYWLMLLTFLMNGPLHCFQQNKGNVPSKKQNKRNETNHKYYLVQFINAINGGI